MEEIIQIQKFPDTVSYAVTTKKARALRRAANRPYLNAAHLCAHGVFVVPTYTLTKIEKGTDGDFPIVNCSGSGIVHAAWIQRLLGKAESRDSHDVISQIDPNANIFSGSRFKSTAEIHAKCCVGTD